MEIDNIYNMDCLEGMKQIPDGTIDAVICDLPYGTTYCAWDSVIPMDALWEQYKRIVKKGGRILLFGQVPFCRGGFDFLGLCRNEATVEGCIGGLDIGAQKQISESQRDAQDYSGNKLGAVTHKERQANENDSRGIYQQIPPNEAEVQAEQLVFSCCQWKLRTVRSREESWYRYL
jgi:hypothetical protein